MNLDPITNLPVTISDGKPDANDTLQRCAWVIPCSKFASGIPDSMMGLPERCLEAMKTTLQPEPGIYVRYPGGNPNDVSGDQLIAALAAWVTLKDWRQALRITREILLRAGFAQNTSDMNGKPKRR